MLRKPFVVYLLVGKRRPTTLNYFEAEGGVKKHRLCLVLRVCAAVLRKACLANNQSDDGWNFFALRSRPRGTSEQHSPKKKHTRDG